LKPLLKLIGNLFAALLKFEFGLDLSVPVLVMVQKCRIEVIAEQGAAGGTDIARFIGLDGEDIAALFVTV